MLKSRNLYVFLICTGDFLEKMKSETETGLIQLYIDTGCFYRIQNNITPVVSIKGGNPKMKPGYTQDGPGKDDL